MLSELLVHTKEFGWIPFLLVFLALPYVYCLLAIDVHKDYAELVKSAPQGYIFDSQSLDRIQDDLHIFELDWWLILSIAMMFVGLFSLGSFASTSTFFVSGVSQAASNAVLGSPPSVWTDASCVDAGHVAAVCSEKAFVRSVLVAYATIVAVFLSFLLVWGRVRAVRRLRSYYQMLRSTTKE